MIFNIKQKTESKYVPKDWEIGNKREDIQFGQFEFNNNGLLEKICDNIFSIDGDVCRFPLSDRWSSGSIIDSSVFDTLKSNNNNVPIYFEKDIANNAIKANFLFSYLDKIFLPKPLERINN